MNNYDDFAIRPELFEVMAKEYAKQNNIFAQSVNKAKEIQKHMCSYDEQMVKDEKELKSMVEYLLVLVKDLKTKTQNADILLVLNNLQSQIENQQQSLNSIFIVASKQTVFRLEINMFCNNLKIALNTTTDIIKLLIKIKDNSDTPFEKKELLTQSINAFLDVNNSLVSLFGECRYLKYNY